MQPLPSMSACPSKEHVEPQDPIPSLQPTLLTPMPHPCAPAGPCLPAACAVRQCCLCMMVSFSAGLLCIPSEQPLAVTMCYLLEEVTEEPSSPFPCLQGSQWLPSITRAQEGDTG